MVLVLDANDMVRTIKQAAVDAVENGKPCDILTGVVTSASPIQINVEQKMLLGSMQLVIPMSFTTHSIKCTYKTDEGTKTDNVTVYGALQAGDKVLLLRRAGGQQFIVMDKVV